VLSVRRIAVVVFLLVSLVTIGLGVFVVQLKTPFRAFDEPLFLDIERGVPTAELAERLEKAGVIRSKHLFLAIRAVRRQVILMAGEYRFSEEATPWQVFDTFAKGRVFLRRLTIPEGLTRFETAELIAKSGYDPDGKFLALTEDPSPVRDLFPQAKTLEGFLFPETYSLPREADAEVLRDAMLAAFRKNFAEAGKGKTTPLEPFAVATLASMIEKETGVGGERDQVSAVFHNRLKRRMLMQCDPTIVYGLILEGRYRGKIYESDLPDPHPYNTYVHAGLPPGPIASPGRASLEAAFRPAESAYLYFVAASATGRGHVFSKTLTEHNKAVAAYRRSEKSR